MLHTSIARRSLAALSFVLFIALPVTAAAQWGPYGPYGPYGYGRYPVYRDELTVALRLEVRPRQAEVYVDGYRAGIVDDYDGIFQRLHLRPGGHEIVLYLDGYRTVAQNVYLGPLDSRSIKLDMTPLAPGEMPEPRPLPRVETVPVPAQPPMRRTLPRALPGGPPSEPQAPMSVPAGPPPASAESARFGTLSVRLVPVNADVLVDGERWRGNGNALEPLTIQLSEGRHKVEVQKDGYEKYSTDIDIRAGETKDLNVGLKRIR